MAKKIGISVFLCVFGLWVSPGVGAAVCTEIVSLLDDHHHTHSEEDGHHDQGRDTNRTRFDACCVKIFVDGPVALVSAPSAVNSFLPQITVVWSASSKLYQYPTLYPSKFLSSTFLQTFFINLQRPLFVLCSVFLI